VDKKKNLTWIIFFIIVSSMFLEACLKPDGEFSFRKSHTDSYKRIKDVPEFLTTDNVEWVYVFSKTRKIYNIGIILMKQEIVWVDINTRSERIDPTHKIIYGKLENMEAGNYKILLTLNGTKLDEKYFIILRDSEDSELDFEDVK